MKTITSYLLTLTFLICRFFAIGQNLPTIQPTVGESNEYSKAEQVNWQKALEQYAKINSDEISYGTLSEKDRIMIDSLEKLAGPLTQGPGCSWYCGGGPYKVTASTYLKDQGKITFIPDNIHDFNLFSAWVSDYSNRAIEKKINFYFEPFAPRVNEIIIWNGYIKNSELWMANSRVAKFKLLINGKPTAILELKDVNNSQSFKIEPVQSTDSTKDLILTLEILEIYKGSKYEDVAVSEINFDGLDVHCFGSGTKITMADNSIKNIENLTREDWILTFNKQKQKLVKAQVSELISVSHSDLLKLKFIDREIIVTDDHPFWTKKNNWASINPTKSNNHYTQDKKVEQLVIGDKIFVPTVRRYIELIAIEKIRQEQMTYSIELSTGDSFIANGLLVKTEKVK